MAVGCHGRGTKEDGCLFIFFKRDPQENNTFHFGSYSIGWNESKLNSIIFLRGEQLEHWWTAPNINTHHTLPCRALSHHFFFLQDFRTQPLLWSWLEMVCLYLFLPLIVTSFVWYSTSNGDAICSPLLPCPQVPLKLPFVFVAEVLLCVWGALNGREKLPFVPYINQIICYSID